MPRPNRRGHYKRCFCPTSVAYIGPKSRTERPRKTKIGTEVAHVSLTRTPLSRSIGQRSPGCFTHRRVGGLGSCSGGRGNVLAVRNCCYVRCRLLGRASRLHEGRRGAYRGGRPPTESLIQRLRLSVYIIYDMQCLPPSPPRFISRP